VIQQLLDRVSRLEQELDLVRRIATFRHQIDMVHFAGSDGFVYTDDLGYTLMREENKRLTPGRRNPHVEPARTIDECLADESQPLLAILFCHYWRQNLDFAVADIGCHYGFTAMATARIIHSFGRNNHVYAFDPGVASNMVPFNLVMNGMVEHVTFERLAISDRVGARAVFADLFHSEDNRIVNRMPEKEVLSYPAMCTSLDAYFRSPQNLILKIDTQGAEPEVFAGMQRLRKERLVTVLTEFTPHAMQTRVKPDEWLREIANEFLVFDAGAREVVLGQKHRVPRVDLNDFAARVDAKPSRYTDLLLVPKKLPALDDLVAHIQAE